MSLHEDAKKTELSDALKKSKLCMIVKSTNELKMKL